MGFDVLRFQVDRHVKVSDGFIVPRQPAFRGAPVVVRCGVVRFQSDRSVGGIEGDFRVFPKQVTDGKPSSRGEIVISFSRDVDDRAPFLDCVVFLVLLLERNGVGNCLIYERRPGVFTDTLNGLIRFFRVIGSSLSVHTQDDFVGFIAVPLNLFEMAFRSFSDLSNGRDTAFRGGLDFPDRLHPNTPATATMMPKNPRTMVMTASQRSIYAAPPLRALSQESRAGRRGARGCVRRDCRRPGPDICAST